MNDRSTQVPKSHSEIYHAVDGRVEYSPYNAEKVLNLKLINGLGDLIPVRIFESDLIELIQDESSSITTERSNLMDFEQVNECKVPEKDADDIELMDSVPAADNESLSTDEEATNTDVSDFREDTPELAEATEIENSADGLEADSENLQDTVEEDELEDVDDLATSLLNYSPESLAPDEEEAEALIEQQDREAVARIAKFKEQLAEKQTHISTDALPEKLTDAIKGRSTTTDSERQEQLTDKFNDIIQADKEQIY